MRVTFQLTAKDYHQGLLGVAKSQDMAAMDLLRCAYLLVGLTILVSLLLPLARHRVPGCFLNIPRQPSAFAVIWFAFMLGAPWLSARQQYRNTPTAQTPISIEASDTGLSVHLLTPIRKWHGRPTSLGPDYKSVFIVLPQPRIYVPIPQRAFTAEQVVEFREMLRRNIKTREK